VLLWQIGTTAAHRFAILRRPALATVLVAVDGR